MTNSHQGRVVNKHCSTCLFFPTAVISFAEPLREQMPQSAGSLKGKRRDASTCLLTIASRGSSYGGGLHASCEAKVNGEVYEEQNISGE